MNPSLTRKLQGTTSGKDKEKTVEKNLIGLAVKKEEDMDKEEKALNIN